MSNAPYDVVVFGATSFVGQIVCHYLAARGAQDGAPLRWAAAGRSRDKLESLRSSLGAGHGRLPLLEADASDPASLAALCRKARVVASTVGPYALYGEPLVRACAESGTDYCDLTGEVQWMRRMIATHEAAARASGARIVHCCGFDSIPSDLGVHHLQAVAQSRFGKPCATVKMRVYRTRGGFSGGTVASMMNLLKEASSNPDLRRELADPYALCPASYAPRVRQHNVGFAEHDPDFDAWLAPFVMSGINTRVVFRSNALAGQPYGREFRYDEAMITGKGLRGQATAIAVSAGLGGFMLAGSMGPSRRLLERFVLPKPGEGPSAEQQRKGFFDLRLVGHGPGGRTVRTRVTGDRDPGYGSTAKMLGEAAACLALDVPAKSVPGGFWTPATAFGDRLIERLRAHAGVQFEEIED
jgi:short subunit dehydrogenase-like uncharacterized protein